MASINRTPPTPGREREERMRSSQISLTSLATVGRGKRLTFNQPVSGNTQEWPDEESEQPEENCSQHGQDQPLLLR